MKSPTKLPKNRHQQMVERGFTAAERELVCAAEQAFSRWPDRQFSELIADLDPLSGFIADAFEASSREECDAMFGVEVILAVMKYERAFGSLANFAAKSLAKSK